MGVKIPSRIVLVAILLAATAGGADRRVVAIGDLHGDYGQFLAVLQSAGLADGRGKWTGGRSVLVQLGDVPDRGPDTRKILDLLMRLEKEAKRAGGEVHPLIGNHEAMNIYGDLRYVDPREFAAFRTRSSGDLREELFRRLWESLVPKPPDEAAQRKGWETEYPLGWVEHRQEMGPEGKYGKWIREHNAVLQVGDSLFLHGGISPKYGSWSLEMLNQAVRGELADFRKLENGVVMDQEGPLWYRELARGAEAELAAHVDAVLAKHGAKRIVIGHTVTPGAVIPRFGGKVILADVGLSAVYGSRLASVVIEGDTVSALHRGRKLNLPQGGAAEFREYLVKAAELDPQPSPLQKLIETVARTGIPTTY